MSRRCYSRNPVQLANCSYGGPMGGRGHSMFQCLETQPGAKSPYASEAAEALSRLGLNVRSSLHESHIAFERFFPTAVDSGYYGALQAAIRAGQTAPHDAADQVRWLATELKVEAPADDDPWPWWAAAWEEASQTAHVEAPASLDSQARRVLLRELLERPDYGRRLVDALAAAFSDQATRHP
jgi:hypothetical protein